MILKLAKITIIPLFHNESEFHEFFHVVIDPRAISNLVALFLFSPLCKREIRLTKNIRNWNCELKILSFESFHKFFFPLLDSRMHRSLVSHAWTRDSHAAEIKFEFNVLNSTILLLRKNSFSIQFSNDTSFFPFLFRLLYPWAKLRSITHVIHLFREIIILNSKLTHAIYASDRKVYSFNV